MQLGFRKRKKTEENVPRYLCKGVELMEPVSMGGQNATMDAVMKGVVETLIVFGGVGGFLSCFDINYYIPVVLMFYLALAFYFSGLYRSGKNWVRDVGYVAYFIIFVLVMRVFSKHLNSGFYAVVNIIYQKASDYYDTQILREFAEVITNRNLTITVAAILLGSIVIIVLNIYISVYMSVTAAVACCLPGYMIPLFFNCEPDSLYVICMVAGIFGVICMKANGHYLRLQNGEQFSDTRRGKKYRIRYSQSGKVMGQMLAAALMVVLVSVSMLRIVYPRERFVYATKKSSVKQAIEEPIQNLMALGIFSLFDFYRSTSGMSAGRLGGVANVRADHQPDLRISFTPYSYDMLYLKGFTGIGYCGDHWTKDREGLYHEPASGTTYGKMRVLNFDADWHYGYLPYYTEDINGELEQQYREGTGLARGGEAYYTYYPYGEEMPPLQAIDPWYYDVPEANRETIARFCEEAGLHGSPREIVQQVRDYFQDNIPYTLKPGSMPRGADFVNYFLEKNKKGYCAHFASAATLIFRYMGIPARYVEGYAVSYLEMMDGDLEPGLKYEDYFHGTSLIGETAVISMNVTDAQAHAWVEVYIDGKWQVAETTPSSDEEDEIDDFWTTFGNLLNGDGGNGAAGENNGQAFSLDRLTILWYIMGAAILLVILFYIGRVIFRKLRRIQSYHRRDKAENVVAYYRYLCEYMRLASPAFKSADSHTGQILLMNPELRAPAAEELAKQLECISYGGSVDGIPLQDILSQLRALRKNILRRVKWFNRLYIFTKL